MLPQVRFAECENARERLGAFRVKKLWQHYLGGLVRLIGFIEHIKTVAVFHINIAPPVVAVAVFIVRHGVVGKDQPQSTAFCSAPLGLFLPDLA